LGQEVAGGDHSLHNQDSRRESGVNGKSCVLGEFGESTLTKEKRNQDMNETRYWSGGENKIRNRQKERTSFIKKKAWEGKAQPCLLNKTVKENEKRRRKEKFEGTEKHSRNPEHKSSEKQRRV